MTTTVKINELSDALYRLNKRAKKTPPWVKEKLYELKDKVLKKFGKFDNQIHILGGEYYKLMKIGENTFHSHICVESKAHKISKKFKKKEKNKSEMENLIKKYYKFQEVSNYSFFYSHNIHSEYFNIKGIKNNKKVNKIYKLKKEIKQEKEKILNNYKIEDLVFTKYINIFIKKYLDRSLKAVPQNSTKGRLTFKDLRILLKSVKG